MNSIFTFIFLVSASLLLYISPDTFLTTLLNGATKAGALSVALLSSYAVWLGLISLWEKSGLAEKLAKFLKPIAKKLFKTNDDKALTAASMNLSVNLLGMSGAATPYGVKAAKLFDKTKNAEYASAMLLVINATSIQLIPTTIVGVRAAMNSVSPSDVILPSLFSTVFSTLLGVILVWLYFKIKDGKAKKGERL